MTEGDHDGRPALSELDRRLQAARARRSDREGSRGAGEDGPIARSEGMAIGLRIAIELAAAVVVGTGIGILLDSWLGTRPWLLILFFILGSAAGFLNVYRTATEYDRRRRASDTGAGPKRR